MLPAPATRLAPAAHASACFPGQRPALPCRMRAGSSVPSATMRRRRQQPRRPPAASATSPSPSSSPSSPPLVVLTREAGKNGKLASALQARGYTTLEMPLVRSGPAEDTAALPDALAAGGPWAWVVLTSPEAAAVFLAAWRAAGRPPVRVAAVGAGTARILDEAEGDDAPSVAFTPTLANAVTLAAELPEAPPGSIVGEGGGGGEGGTASAAAVLYPASAKAGSDLQAGLAARGCFTVTRLNTYDTLAVPAGELGGEALAAARGAAVVALASPSAAKAWVAAAGGLEAARAGPAIAAIGATTGLAAQKQGLERVHWPAAPGLEGFIEAVVDASGGGVVV